MSISVITFLFRLALSPVNHGSDSDFLALDAIDHDKVSPGDDQFSGAFPSRPSKMREVNQPLDLRHEAGNHAVSRAGVIEGDVMADLVNLTPCFGSPGYPH